jgi:hypothetical protein
VVVRVRDLNGGHLRFHFPILWDQNPPFLVDAALGVSRDAPLVDGRYRAAIREDSDPLGLQQQSKRRIHFRRNHNAFEHSTASAVILKCLAALTGKVPHCKVTGFAPNRDLARRYEWTVKFAERQAVLFPVESVARTSNRYEPIGSLLMSIPRPTGIIELPACM